MMCMYLIYQYAHTSGSAAVICAPPMIWIIFLMICPVCRQYSILSNIIVGLCAHRLARSGPPPPRVVVALLCVALCCAPVFPAGVATIAPILEATVEDWDWTMNVRAADLRTAAVCCRQQSSFNYLLMFCGGGARHLVPNYLCLCVQHLFNLAAALFVLLPSTEYV